MTELVEVPAELANKIGADGGRSAWPWFADRDAAHWGATPYHHNGDQVMLLLDGDDGELVAATRPSVEATYGPLTEVPHCTTCGSYLFYRGACRSLVCRQA
ncbi:hypothetical protein [Streptomyces sp. NEAU-174]|uniref:hypothetical protein n=1 Tax=Streptomyces sp. NEAU-174 TaxID=3458254 RepID=UPI00404468B6